MAQYGYSIKDMNETRAHACMRDVPISYKTATMIAQKIKGLPASKAIGILQGVQKQTIAIPYTKFNDSVGHRPNGMGPGRYPEKAAALFEKLVKNAVANAEDKNLGSDVSIEFAIAQRASLPWHQGSQGRHKMKRSHVEIVVTNATLTSKKAKKAASDIAKKNKAPKKAEKVAKVEAPKTESKSESTTSTKEPKESKKESKKPSEAKK